MKKDIILCGVGGQGILSIAAAIGMAAMEKKLKVKQAEVHGMSQRGGSVQSHLRLSDGDIASDLIQQGRADIILSVEPMESLRYLPFLAQDGWLISNTTPFDNIPDYPPFEDIIEEIQKVEKHILIDADSAAKDCGSIKASNMVMLGAVSSCSEIENEYYISAIQKIFKNKGKEVIDINIKAFKEGIRLASAYFRV